MDPSEVTVLVVEDDYFTRMATIDILMSCRYRVDAVEDGKQALEKLQNHHGEFDLVLCDMMLPVMNGIELLDELRKDSNLNHIPVVMTSSNEEMDVVASCLNRGAKDYLIKPIQVNTAKTLVRHVWLSRQLERVPSKSMWQDLEVIRSIGKGTHGTVVLARRRLDGAVVAVKRVRTSQISDVGRKQADNEVVLLKSLYHVNIVRFYDHFTVDDELNIVMEYADGGNLRQLARKRIREKIGPFPEKAIMSWFAQLVLAVAYIHGKNVLHRDLKAQNVFFTRSNVVKLGDFGISKALSGDLLAKTACGTPETMSPEICRGEPYGKKSDIWSLGCILYEMIMLHRPFEAETLPGIFSKICNGDYPPILPFFSRDLRLLVQLMLQQDPWKRPSIDDISRFPFVQGPLQQFLSEHVVEFQEALELEAKLHQPSLYSTQGAGNKSPSSDAHPNDGDRSAPNGGVNGNRPRVSSAPNGSSRSDALIPPPLTDEKALIRESAMAAAAVAGVVAPEPPMPAAPPMSIKSFVAGSTSTSTLDDSLADQLRSRVVANDIHAGFFATYAACVPAFELVLTLKKQFRKTDVEAKELLADMIKEKQLNLVHAEDMNDPDLGRGDTYLRFQVDETSVALNMKYVQSQKVSKSATEVCLNVRQLVEDLFRLPAFPRGISTGFRKSKSPSTISEPSRVDEPECLLYRQFLKSSAQLQQADIAALPKHERQAFFINIYNTMVLHGLIEFGIPQDSGQYRAFEKNVNYTIGGLNFTLGDIKHGILRCNQKPPSNYWERQLMPHDPKLEYKLHMRDPRSLLVLFDCTEPLPPPGQVPIFKPGRIDTDLEEQVKQYCKRNIEVDEDAMELTLPRIFFVFRNDFGVNESEIIRWLSQYMPEPPSNITAFRVNYQNGILT